MPGKVLLAIFVSWITSSAIAGTLSIGTVNARGDIQVDNHTIKGNATLFDGSVLKAVLASAVVRIDQGTTLTLGTNSQATFKSGRAILQQGAVEFDGGSPIQIEANGLQILPVDTSSRGLLSVASGNSVEVSASAGNFRVANSKGDVLANVGQGRSVLIDSSRMVVVRDVSSANSNLKVINQTPNWAGP